MMLIQKDPFLPVMMSCLAHGHFQKCNFSFMELLWPALKVP